jgi:hypothetical protein
MHDNMLRGAGSLHCVCTGIYEGQHVHVRMLRQPCRSSRNLSDMHVAGARQHAYCSAAHSPKVRLMQNSLHQK